MATGIIPKIIQLNLNRNIFSLFFWQCDKLCGDGVQKRQLKCYRKTDGKIEVLNDADCPDTKPDETKECILRPCEGVDWITSSWSGVSLLIVYFRMTNE